MKNESTDDTQKKEYREYPYRFLIITLYLLTSLVNQLPVNTFSAITTLVQKNFDIPTQLITLNYLICPISHTICVAPVNWMLTKKGIKISYYIANIMMIAGLWFRTTLSNSNPYLCLLGSFLCGSSGLFIMNSASKISQNWFRADVLTITTFLTVMGSFISIASGLIVPGLMLNSESNAADIIYFLRVQAILISIPFVLLVIFIKEKPETPPSRAAEAEH